MALKPSSRFPGQVIVHVGDHKAGSTTIQSALARGDVTLEGGRLVYPLIGARFNQNHLAIRSAGKITLDRLRSGFAKGKSKRPGFGAVARVARKQSPDLTVLSAEELENAPPKALAAELDAHFPTGEGALWVVSFIRPHAGRAISGLAEQIKIGWAGPDPWASHIVKMKTRLRFAPRVAAWREVFGPAYVVRPMIRGELENGDLLQDLFAHTIGPGRVKVRPGPSANESLGIEDLMRLQVVQQALPAFSRWQHHDIGWNLAQHLIAQSRADSPRTPLRLHRALAEELHAALRDDAAALDTLICGGRPVFSGELDRAVDTAVPEQMSLRPQDWLSGDEIRSLQAMAGLIGDTAGAQGWRGALKQALHARMIAR